METATLAGGCFWCLEAVFNRLEGVTSVQSGYMGGTVARPTYEQVCTGKTGHAEVVQLTFDPAAVSFAEILDVFFAMHDPTTPNRQGNDVGPQYRSAIFYHSPEQRRAAEEALRKIPNAVTELRPASDFYPAEDYHTRYFENHPAQPYCAYVVAPKVKKLESKFPERLKA
ncbi:MAG TPA: peptide-methionine (S)-S-oxide reductase MsrA [Bryobacteraceae bacterium]|nr:peptide-methionine (S)-S-oxide reductase MsrA [Bryobacteraceae bacterium]